MMRAYDVIPFLHIRHYVLRSAFALDLFGFTFAYHGCFAPRYSYQVEYYVEVL